MENENVGALLKGTVLCDDVAKGYIKARKVKVKVVRREGGWLPSDHEASVMVEGAERTFCVPGSESTGQLVNPLEGLSPEQLDTLAKRVGLEGGESFNIHLKKDKNYWHRFGVKLDRNGLMLDLGKPIEFLKWCVLRSDTDNISPTWKDRLQRGTYQYALVEQDEESVSKLKKADEVKEAYLFYGRLSISDSQMRDFLFAYYLDYKNVGAQKPSKQATTKWLKEQIVDLIENHRDRFLELANDPTYETKLLIKRAVDAKIVTVQNKKYYIPNRDEPVGHMTALIKYLDDDENQEDRIEIMAQLNNDEE